MLVLYWSTSAWVSVVQNVLLQRIYKPVVPVKVCTSPDREGVDFLPERFGVEGDKWVEETEQDVPCFGEDGEGDVFAAQRWGVGSKLLFDEFDVDGGEGFVHEVVRGGGGAVEFAGLERGVHGDDE